jgi:hypothetical protein
MLLASSVGCSPNGAAAASRSAAVDAFVREWLIDHASRASVSSEAPAGVVLEVARYSH